MEVEIIQQNTTIDISNLNTTVDLEGGSGIANTDELPEGENNLYHTPERVFDTMTDVLQAGSNITLTVDENTQAITINAAGGGVGAVDSVNGQTGSVVLDTDDILEGNNKYFNQNLVIALATVL